ncbi:class I SAM-dependent methyltransferase [Rhizorhabdus argentea]|uniref:class I SAM-dependent methyltransferase n=1 Tax=Rhizorhabdus argentea TaxID=1387174 RepID=UPI0030EB4608
MHVMAKDLAAAGFKTLNANGHLIHYAEQGAGWRYDTLLDKEPETIAWIDTFQPGETFWDVGANVGIYSIYAGARGIRTVAFEPHFANYHQFCITIAANGLQDLVTPLCLAFAEGKSIAEMNLASLDIGTSMSNFGAALDFRGQPFEPAFRQGMIGYDIDGFVADFGVEIPTHLKIDVDGIELAIVKGARATLASEKLRSVSIELIESDAAQVAAVTAILEGAGLHFIHKQQNAAFATPETRDVLNYLFHRDPVALAARIGAIMRQPVAEDEPVTTDAIIERIVDRIAAARVDPAPSGNIFMEDMLPANVYRELLSRLPGDEALDPIDHPDAIGADGKPTRFLLDLTPASLSRLALDDQPFWEAMIEVFTAPAIADAIIAKFAPTLHERFGEELPDLVAVPILYRDHPGYRIGVHPDAPSKIATLQFYLPEDDSQRHLGTSFHQRSGDGFERLKTNDFRPNAAYAFVRTEESWHSVDELGPDEQPRNSIALTFYIRGQEYRSEAMPETASCYDEEMSRTLQTLAKTFTRRDDVATLFREGGVGVELGVAAGDFSERILQYDHVGYLFSIDMWAGDRGHGVDQYREAIGRLSPYRDRNAILRMRFDEALHLFGEESLDFIYVDGYAHDGELNGATFRDWLPKLRRGGIIAGDDYAPDWPLVMAAVDRFVAENGLELHVIDCHEDSWNSMYPTWFAMKP